MIKRKVWMLAHGAQSDMFIRVTITGPGYVWSSFPGGTHFASREEAEREQKRLDAQQVAATVRAFQITEVKP